METEIEIEVQSGNKDKLNKNLNSTTEIDPRLEMFFDKFKQFQEKLNLYEQKKVEAEKEKDMWYDKSVQLEKQLQEFQNGNFSSIKKKKRTSNRRKEFVDSDEKSFQRYGQG